MTLSPGAVLLLFAAPLALGTAILRLMGIRCRDDRFGFFAWAWISGAFGWSVAALAALLLGHPTATLMTVIGGAAAVGAWVAARRFAPAPPAPVREPRPFRGVTGLIGGFLFAVAIAVVLHHIVRANEQRIVSGDEASIWQAKARAYFDAGGYDARLEELVFSPDTPLVVHHEDYPPLNPLLQLWTFALAGKVVGIECRWPMQASMVALVVLLGAALFRRVHPLVAGVLVFVFATSYWTGWLAEFAYSDHLVALGFLAAVDAWMTWRESGDRRWIAPCAMGLAFAAWSKNEGALLAVACLAGALVERFFHRGARTPSIGRGASWFVWPVLVLLALNALNRAMGFKNDLVLGKDGRPFWRLFFNQWSAYAGTVLRWFSAILTVFWPHTPLEHEPALSFTERAKFFGLIPPAFLLVVLTHAKTLVRSTAAAPIAAVLAAIAGYFAIYVGTPNELIWHLGTSLGRVLYSIFPAMTLAFGAAIAIIRPALARPGPDAKEPRT